MKKVLVIILFVWGIASSQTTYISKEHDSLISPLLERIKTEYKYNGVTNTKFHLLDSILIKDLPYPEVGWWIREEDSHKILLHTWLTKRESISLEYTFKHELGHLHGLKHTKDSKDIMFSFHSAPSTKEEWEKMNNKYYTDLKKITNKNKPKN
jgi:hypothetical protein